MLETINAIYVLNRTCINKKDLSKECADRIIDAEADRGNLLFYYKCEFCNRYHITKRAGEVVKIIKVL